MPRARNAIASTATRTPRIVTTRTPLFDEAGWREDGADLGEMRSGIFLPRNLDDPNHVESAGEIRVLAQRVWMPFECVAAATSADLSRPAITPQLGAATTSTGLVLRRPPTRRRGRVDCSLDMSVVSVAVAVRRSDTDRAAPPLLPGLDALPSAATAAAVLNHQRVDAAAAAV
jgi:hypothetical protein